MKRFRLSSLLVGLLALPFGHTQAEVVQVTGRAPVEGALSYAREQAMEDALHQASLQAGAQISGMQLMEKGVVSTDTVRVSTRSQVSDVEILREDTVNGMYEVTIRADVDEAALCPASVQSYRKAVAVAGFGLAQPQQATLGRLENIEQGLPRWLAAELNSGGGVHALDATRISLYQDPRRAPSAETAQQRLTTSVALATQLGAQYVVSGVVRDLALHTPQKSGFASRLMGFATAPTRDFVMDVFVHDGLSGAMLFQRSYRTEGEWEAPRNEKTGFATPQFWATSYGTEVADILKRAAGDVDEMLRCQPFMARIVRARGNRLHIEASAAAGLRPGDTLKVYRTGTLYNLDLEPRTELTDMAAEAVVKQVQPQFVIAELGGPAERLAIQRDDMVIAW